MSRELDALVARHVMPTPRADTEEGALDIVPLYSSDIGAAWQVWDKLPKPRRLTDGERGPLGLTEDNDDALGARFFVLCGGASYGAQTDFSHTFAGWGETPAEAICRAALLAVGVTPPS